MSSPFRYRRLTTGRCQVRSRATRAIRFEALESRRLLASGQPVPAGEPSDSVYFRFDYSHDTGFFKNHPERRELLELAGRLLTDRLSDTLDAIPASNSSIRWEAHYTNPRTGANTKLPAGFAPAANEIVVYVGSRNLQYLDSQGGTVRSYADGVKTPFSYACSSTTQTQCTAFGKTLTTRGEGVTQGTGAVDFAPFVASLTFDNRSDTVDDWNFDDGPLQAGQHRFLTFAQHELAHVLGFGIANSFTTKVQAGKFVGAKTDAAYVGAGHLPLNGGHIAQSVAGEQSTIMTSSIQSGGLFGSLDFAVLDDIGWQVVGDSRRAVTMTTSAEALPENAGAFELTATLSSASSTPISVPVSIRGTGKLGSDVSLSANQFVFAANQKTATISVQVIDDGVYEAAESINISLLDSVYARLGSNPEVQLTVFDDDGLDLASVRRDDPASATSSLTIPGDRQPHGIVFRASKTQNLSVTAQHVEHIDAGVLLYDRHQNIIGTYSATGLASADLTTGESYALVFYPRTVPQTFTVGLPGGLASVTARHNVLFPADVNGNYNVTEVDALQIINQLNQSGDDFSVDASTVSGEGFYDVNGDGLITAVDALQVINFLNGQGPAGEPLASANADTVAPIPWYPTPTPTRLPDSDTETPVQTFDTPKKQLDAPQYDEAKSVVDVKRIDSIDRIFATVTETDVFSIELDLLS